jgi:competence ComEA-like helix-hairpin-helix protein
MRDSSACFLDCYGAVTDSGVMNKIMWIRRALRGLLILLVLFAASGARADTKNPPAHPIDLNTATAEQLQQVPGIGPSTAKAIVNFRRKSGPFLKIEDLLAIKGVSKARLEKMRPYLAIGPSAQKSP